MTFDLHCHSHLSDGAHSPEQVALRARANGVTHLAFKEHDFMADHSALAQSLGGELDIIPGVEISTLHEGKEIHVVGLCLKADNPALVELLAGQQAARRARLQELDRMMSQAGITGLLAYVSALPTRVPSRTHAADFIVSKRLCRDRGRAFQSYLGRRGKFYAKPAWCPIEIAIKTIQAAGGLAILAHPHRYATTQSGLRRLAGSFAEAGGDGMEVACSNLDRGMLDRLAAVCMEARLLASCGSDFHSASASWMDLGRLPDLPQSCKKNAIWLAAGWHP